MPDGPNALCAAPEGICGIVSYPLNCLGQVVDLTDGEPVLWSDPIPAGGLSAVGTLTHTETILYDPVLKDDEIIAENRPGEYTEEGYVKYFEGVRTLDRTVNTAAETVMGLIDSHVDAASELVKSTTPITGADRCSVCGPGNCPPRWAEIVYQPLFDIVQGTRTPTLRGGAPLYRIQVYPSLRAIGGVNVGKARRAADQPDRTVTVRAEAGPAFWTQLKANPPAWFPSTDVIDVRSGATINPLTSDLYDYAPYADFYSTTTLPTFMTDGSCQVCGWLNPPAVEEG